VRKAKKKRVEFEVRSALEWHKPTYVSACHLDIGELLVTYVTARFLEFYSFSFDFRD
jgi:hypothetical protein